MFEVANIKQAAQLAGITDGAFMRMATAAVAERMIEHYNKWKAGKPERGDATIEELNNAFTSSGVDSS